MVWKKDCQEKPFVYDLQKNIASIPKPDKTVVIENQRSRFGNQIKNVFIFCLICSFYYDIYTTYFTLLTFVDLVFITFKIINIICIRLWKMFPNLP